MLGGRGARQARSPGRLGLSGHHVLGGRGARQARSPAAGEAARQARLVRLGRSCRHVLGGWGARQARSHLAGEAARQAMSPGRRGQSGRHVLKPS